MKPKGAAWGASFAAMPVAAWPVIAEHLSHPWPEEAARFDLRWFADQNKRQVPGRYDLAERWGWTPDEVRTLLRNAGRWWDPLWGPAPTKREGTLTHGDPARPKLTHADPPATGEPEESNTPDPARPTVTQADPTSPQRDPSSPSQAPTPPQQDIPAPPVQPTLVGPPAPPKIDPHREAWHTAALFWGSQVLPACGRKPSSGPESPSKGIGSKLMTAVRNDAEAVLDALRFVAWSQHSRALHFRAERYDLDTVLRHVEAYSGLWREFGDKPLGGTQERRTGGPAPPSAGDGVLDRLWAMEQAAKRAEEFEA
jgi:hypothetical protein